LPNDGRYGENPIRFQQFLQGQVILRPSPDDADVYFKSLAAIGIDLVARPARRGQLGGADARHVRLGWEVWLDGLEIAVDVLPATRRPRGRGRAGRITYGLDRIAMFLFGRTSVLDVEWAPASPGATSTARTSASGRRTTSRRPVDVLMRRRQYEQEASTCSSAGAAARVRHGVEGLHAFNLLDARALITERAAYIGRLRAQVPSVPRTGGGTC
jgi:glycyl-tRNA synthetase alpha subunit